MLEPTNELLNRKPSQHPCPICGQVMFVVGKKKGKSLTSCGHAYAFKGSRSKKDMDRRFVRTPWGLELIEEGERR